MARLHAIMLGFFVAVGGASSMQLPVYGGGGDDGGGGGSCPSTCSDSTCDYWNSVGFSCEELELDYGCDCSGCSCDDDTGGGSSYMMFSS